MTYLPPAQGWVYLATVKDIFSRPILGWALDDSLEATLVAAAWQRALRTRGFAACQGPILYPSDRGSQYCGTLFQDLLRCSGTQHQWQRRVSGQCRSRKLFWDAQSRTTGRSAGDTLCRQNPGGAADRRLHRQLLQLDPQTYCIGQQMSHCF